ncbi:MAG: S9 family peptidase [Acidobacteria bacterium]|nr:S9 family peptidase [Acidobacteriota bacterium]
MLSTPRLSARGRRPRRAGAAGPVIALAVLLVAPHAVPAAAAQSRPAFTLEQIVATRMLGQFVMSPDRTRAVFTRVGRFFGHPLFPAYGDDNNLVVVDLATGALTQITSGTSPKTYPSFSPDGRLVAYESEGDIWTVEIATGRARRLTTHAGPDRSAAWSPDGREIAFVSNRWGRAGVYVMAAEGERTHLRRVTEDGFSGANPVWSADGLAIMVTAARDEHFYSRGIYRVPAAGGAAARLTPEDNARNGWPSVSPDGRRVAYVSDRSGFLNIWTMAPDGTDHRQVTRVPQDQDYPENDYIHTMGLRWSPDGRRLLYFTNRLGNLDLMIVDAERGTTDVVENRDGSHHPVGWVDDRTVAYVYESHAVLPDLYVKPLGGTPRQLTFSAHAAFRPEHFDRLESITWKSADGVEVHGYLRRPRTMPSGARLPAVVVSHTYNVGQFYNQWNPIFAYLAESGYVLLFVNHRGSNGYGTGFRDLPKGDWGFAQLKDIESAAALLKARPDVDPARVGMLGYSMGGYLTMLALTARPALFAAGITVFGLGEIVGDPDRSSRNYVWHIGGTEAEKPDEYRARSPVTHAAQMQAPMLILHSDGDPIEPVTKVHNFTQALDRHGKPYEVRIYTNEAHGLRQLDHQLDAYERVVRFLDRHLRPCDAGC